jgi:hypothetical protein
VLGCKFATDDIRGSAAQNYMLLRLLPFLIGNLIQPDDEAWELCMLLRNVCDIVFAPVIYVKWLPVLDQYIHDHHRLFISLDANAFTPKMHFLCHYPRLIEVCGP